MFKIRKISALATLVLALSAQAEIRETKTMTDVLSATTQDSFVVFDIDNTLVEPLQTLGSDQWFDAMVKSNGLDFAVKTWARIQPRTRVRPVEEITPSVVAEIQSKGVPVIALTARPLAIAETTLEQLRSVGIDFVGSAPSQEAFALPGRVEAIRYQNGIIFAGGNSKGETIVEFFRHLNIRPARLVFADDKAKHTKTVEAALDGIGIPNVEFRYGAADERVAAYDPKVAGVQLHFFDAILDDESAERLVN